jgi:hypothetical protein
MNGLAPAGSLFNPGSLLARYAHGIGTDQAGAAGHGRPTGAGIAPVTKDQGQQPAIASGVLAHISDQARALFAQMKQQGVESASFDVHLDLNEAGVSVDGKGSSAYQHSLSIDLHVDAQQGVMHTDHGDVSFGELNVQFDMQETWVRTSGQAPQAPGQAQPDAADTGADDNGGSSIQDTLQSLARLLGGAAAKAGKDTLDLNDVVSMLGRQVDRLTQLLSQLGQALKSAQDGAADSAKPDAQDAANGPAGQDSSPAARPPAQAGDAASLQAFELQLTYQVQIRSLSFQRAPAADKPTGASALPAVEGAAAV